MKTERTVRDKKERIVTREYQVTRSNTKQQIKDHRSKTGKPETGRIESDLESDLCNKRTFESMISPKALKASSRARSSVAQASPPTKHRYSTSAEAMCDTLKALGAEKEIKGKGKG